MKTLILAAVASLLLAVCLPARAAVIITNINLGSAANDGTGDTLRGALTKAMTNFHRLNYGKIESTNGVSVAGNVLTTDGTNWYGATPIGSVTVLTPLILSGTEIQLPLVLSNLKTNLALTNANANQFSTSGGTAIKSGVLLTNTVNEGNFTNNTTGAGFIRQISSAANGGFEAIVGGTTLASLSTLLGIRATNTLGSKLLVSDDVGSHSFMSRTGTFFSGHLLLDSNLVVSGGSTLSSLTASRPLILNASGNVTNATGTPDGTKFLRDDGTLAVPSGSGTPGGSTTQIQYNNAGAFGGSSLFTYEEASSTGTATVRGTSVGAPSLRVAFDNGTIKRTNAMIETGLQLYDNQNDPAISLAVGYFGTGFSTVSFYTNRFYPTRTNHYDAGTFLFPFRTNYANDFVAKNSVTASSFIGSGTGAAQLQLFSTNGNAAVLGISSDTISVTNVLGVSRRGTNNLMFDMNFVGKFTITNKFDFAASITFSNCAEGQEYAGILSGGGTSRVITFRADTNCLFADLDAFGVARATTKAVTLTNGNDMEISAYVTRPLGSAFGTTNVINLITRQYAQ